MKKYGIFAGILSFLAALPELPAADALPAEIFMARVRHSQTVSSSGTLSGTLQHRKEGNAMEQMPVRLEIQISPQEVRGVLALGGDEAYRIRLVREMKTGEKASVSVQRQGKMQTPDSIQRYGLDPADLAMGFVYYDWQKELAPERIKGLPCRVMVLAGPGKGKAVRAYILSEYYFPLKVEFFEDVRSADEGKNILRTLEVGSFRQKNGLYYAELVKLRGGNWQTRVTFDKADVRIVPSSGASAPAGGAAH